jgi:acetylornithine deacetylase
MVKQVEKKQVLAFLDARREELIAFLCELVATPSINPPGDERAVASVIVKKLHTMGLGDTQLVARREERPNVLCRLPGGGGSPVLLFNGHIDTKPVGEEARDAWKTDPLEPTIIDGKLYGLGSTDMKGGVAAMIYAAGALRATEAGLEGDLLLAFTADEEAGSEYGARHLVKEGHLKADIALISEPCGLQRDWERLCIASRGALCFRTCVHGTQMHSSISDIVPSINASAKMAYVLWRMQRDLNIQHEPHPYYPRGVTKNIGDTVQGGVFYGVTPGYAEFCSDIRILPGMTPAQVARDVRSFLDQLRKEDPELQVEIVEELGKPETWETKHPEVLPDEPLVEMLLSASEHVLGKRPPLGGMEGGTDAYYLHGQGGIPTVPAFGPGLLPLAHGPNEYVDVQSVFEASKIYALAALDYLGKRPAG